jgi:hypothetical protein
MLGRHATTRVLDGVEVSHLGRIFARSVFVGRAPRMVLGINDFMKAFDVRVYWSRTPPEFWIEPTQPPKVRSRKPPSDPTIRRRKR